MTNKRLYMQYSQQSKPIIKDEDDISLADLISLKISTSSTEEKSPMMMENTLWNDWIQQNEMYQYQLQSSYYQLQYLQQQQLLSFMRNNPSSKRSSTVSSTTTISSNKSSTVSSQTSSHSRYPRPSSSHYQLSPSSSSNSSIKQKSIPEPTRPIEPIKRRQSLGKRIKKVLGMNPVHKPDELPLSNSVYIKKKGNPIDSLPSPASSIHSQKKSFQSSSNFIHQKKKTITFNPIIQFHETFTSIEYDRRCDTNATCQKLTPDLALKIKEELNNFKLNDMPVHIESRQYTHFFM